MQFVADYPGYCEKLVLLASASTRGYPFFGTKVDGTPDLEHRFKQSRKLNKIQGKHWQCKAYTIRKIEKD